MNENLGRNPENKADDTPEKSSPQFPENLNNENFTIISDTVNTSSDDAEVSSNTGDFSSTENKTGNDWFSYSTDESNPQNFDSTNSGFGQNDSYSNNGFGQNSDSVNSGFGQNDSYSNNGFGQNNQQSSYPNYSSAQNTSYSSYGSQPSYQPYNNANDGSYRYSRENITQDNAPEEYTQQQTPPSYNSASVDPYANLYGQNGFPQQPSSPAAEEKGSKKNKKKKHGTFLYVTIGVLSLLLVCTMIFNVVILSTGMLKTSNSDSSQQGENNGTSEGKGFAITESPQTDLTTIPFEGELLTSAQVSEKVRKSVVSVITYNPTVLGQSAGQGSGIIYSEDGYIVTNSHVISNTKNISVVVVLSTGEEYDATVLGFDERTDIAVLKIDATGLPAAEFGESDKLVTGDEVIAIGNPYGEVLAGSITKGIVSGIDRVIDTTTSYSSDMKYIQTDAAINPGNSGGALVNMYGQVIGINTAKVGGEDYEGLGFAIPISTVQPIVSDLTAYGYVTGRVKLGIGCNEIGSTAAQYYGVPAGLLLQTIDADSDLNGKVSIGDIITGINGTEIESLTELQDILRTKKAGETVSLSIYRPASRTTAAKTFEVSVKVIADTGESSAAQTPSSQGNNNSYNNYDNFDDYSSFFDYFN